MPALADNWWLAADAGDDGEARGWHLRRPDEAAAAAVPGFFQAQLPGRHGVVWYWHHIEAWEPPDRPTCRAWLKFWAVDYRAHVWLNGRLLGMHEGAEAPFAFDVTDALHPAEPNLLAIRVLTPVPKAIDGIRLSEVPHRNRRMPYVAGASLNLGGITDAVELLALPDTRIDDLWVHGAPHEQAVTAAIEVCNDANRRVDLAVDVCVTPAAGGTPHARGGATLSIAANGRKRLQLSVPSRGLQPWDPEHPFLHLATVRLAEDGRVIDERSTRFGLRSLRFADGGFELNGRRLFLRMSHTVNDFPLVADHAEALALLRRDLVHLKAMGFNVVRFIWGGARREQLDLCDEIGLMVYAESFAAWPLDASPDLPRRFHEAVAAVIRRDRHHASIVAWGLLNEAQDDAAFRCAVEMLDLVQDLDGTRLTFLNSGRFDGRRAVASLASPGSRRWDVELGGEAAGAANAPRYQSWPPTDARPMGTSAGLGDVHIYPRVPHTTRTIAQLRELGSESGGPLLVSEYGIGSAVDLWRTVRQFEQRSRALTDDAAFYRSCLDRFLDDWSRWRLEGLFGHPSEFFAQSAARMAGERLRGIDALRANPRLIGYGLTGAVDQVMCGEGLASTFRELKPGAVDAVSEALSPLRLCLFADRRAVADGDELAAEVVLIDEGVLAPGDYPLEILLLGPADEVADRWSTTVTVVDDARRRFVTPCWERRIRAAGPTGRWRLLARLAERAAPTGGSLHFDVLPALPQVANASAVHAADADARDLLAGVGVDAREWNLRASGAGRVIVCSWPGDDSTDPGAARLREVAEAGAIVVCLVRRSDATVDPDERRPFPLLGDAELCPLPGWLYQRDDWRRPHPAFDGLPKEALMDYGCFADVLPDWLITRTPGRTDAVAGAIKASQGYASGLSLVDAPTGSGRVIATTLGPLDWAASGPVADRLVMNLVRHAVQQASGANG